MSTEAWISLGIQLFVLIAGLIGGFFAVYNLFMDKVEKNNQSNIDRLDKSNDENEERIKNLHTRINELKDGIASEYVTNKVHDIHMKNIEEKTNAQFTSVMTLFQSYFNSLQKSIDKLEEQVKTSISEIKEKLDKMGTHR